MLDLFAGGGAIPLEAARLGCESHAVDYNPVAHLIQLCTLVYPQTFGAELADEFRQWSGRILERMRIEIGDLYGETPPSKIPEKAVDASRTRADPVSWIWARTVPCRHPGCKAPVPLVRQSWLRKKGKAIAAVPRIEDGARLCWDIVERDKARDIAQQTGQTGSGQAACVACNTPAPAEYVKKMAVAGRMGESLAAVVAALPAKEGKKKREKTYLSPDVIRGGWNDGIELRLSELLAEIGCAPLDETLPGKLRDQLPAYGFETFGDLFTSRQLLVLFTFVKHTRQAHREMMEEGVAEERARALTTFFAMAFGRFVIKFNKFSRWEPRAQETKGAIGDRQALKMVYDFSDVNPMSQAQGYLKHALEREEFCIRKLAGIGKPCIVSRGNAEKLFYDDETFDAVLTDPPYYSSIYYADLSAFFYVWLKRIVGDLYPEHFTLAAPPKRREAVAQPSEHGGDAGKAKEHYERLMRNSLAEARRVLKPGAPLVCVYAHRTTEGWATLIRALIEAGMTVTEAWPVQTESRGRVNAMGAAALSDSIFFVARRRERGAVGQYETEVEPELRKIAEERVETLWNGGKGIGGADLLMAAVGAGLRAYSRFDRVEYANGEPVSAERYLRDVQGVVLEGILKEVFGLPPEEAGTVDPVTRFYILWRFTWRDAAIEAGDAYVFCQSQGVEIDGPKGLSGATPRLVEKAGGKFRIRDFRERGGDASLGIAVKDKTSPLIDALHRLLHLLEERPAAVGAYLKSARPNIEQLRLVATALAPPALQGRQKTTPLSDTAEYGALTRLNANWRSVVEGAASTGRFELRRGNQP